MRYFFIDTENISRYTFIDEYKLNSDDKIIIFISNNSKNIRIEDLKRITCCNSAIEYEEVCINTKNALDFQLISYLSLLTSGNHSKEDYFYIVSDDKDFDYPIKYLKAKTNANIKILRSNKSTSTIKTKTNSIYSSLDLNEEVLSIIKKSSALNILHNNLRNTYGNEGTKLYKKIKPYFSQSL